MKVDLNKITKRFMLNEAVGPDINSWIQSLKENLGLFKSRSVSESRRVELMKHQLAEVRRAVRRMQNEVVRLEEENKTLLESKENEEE